MKNGEFTSEYRLTQVSIILATIMPLLATILLAFKAIPVEAFLALVTPGPVSAVASGAYAYSRAHVKGAEAAATRQTLFDEAIAGAGGSE